MIASIPSPDQNTFEIGPLTVHFYGIALAAGMLAAVTLAARRWRQRGGDPAVVHEVALWGIAAGVAGARIAYVLPRLDRFEGRWLRVLFIWEGGLAIYGGLIAGTVVGVLVARRAGVRDLASFADAVVPGIPLAQAIGRLGNYANQELFGRPTDLPWGLEIDPDRRPARFADAETFHPTFLYESLWNLTVVAVLVWLDRRRVLRRGSLFPAYLVLYSIGRFGTELLRVDTTFRVLGLSRNALFALAVIVVGSAVIVVRERRRPEEEHEQELAGLRAGTDESR